MSLRTLARKPRLASRAGAVLGLALTAALSSGGTASGYGIATHAWLAEEAANRLAQQDPALGFLATDPFAKACYVYGAFFPDTRSIARQAPQLERLRSTLQGVPLIKSVLFDTTDVQAAFRAFNTHDSQLALLLIDRARQTGDRYKIAFAYGNLTHILQDKHAQTMIVPSLTQSCPCGDLGLDASVDPAAVASFYPGTDNEIVIEGYGDQLRPAATLAFLRDAPWRLDANETVSYNRALGLRRFYFDVAVQFTQGQGLAAPSEAGVLNGARLFEVSCTLYPTFTGHEPPHDVMRLFIFRYLELEWWASLVNGVATLITQNLTGATDLLGLLGPFVPMGEIGSQVGGNSPVAEMLFAAAHGPAEMQRVRTKYAGNLEVDRLLASGLIDPATYATVDYETSHVLVLDGCTRLGASRYADNVVWPTYSQKAMRTAGIRSLLRMAAPDGTARAPDLIVWEVRHEDAGTGQPFGAEVRLPADVGRSLRLAVELYGTRPDPEPRLLRLRLRADVSASAADPILAEGFHALAAAALDVRSYGSVPRPVIALDWVVADVPGARGVYVELDEVRVGLVADDRAVDRLLTTELSAIAPLTAGRPHYARHYVTYASGHGSLPVRR